MTKKETRYFKPKKPTDWFMYQIFYAVASTGSLISAEKVTGLSFHYISKIIATFEESCGMTLFVRSNHRIELTAAGRRVYEKLKGVKHTIEDCSNFLQQARQGIMDEIVHMGSMYSLGMALMRPFADDMKRRFPSLKVKLDLLNLRDENRVYDYDCALCYGEPARKNYCADYLYHATSGIYASKHYLETHKEPTTIDELLQCDYIVASYKGRGPFAKRPDWIRLFEDNYQKTTILSSHMQFIVDAVINHKGFGMLENHQALSWPLKRVLKDYKTQGRPVYFIYPKEHEGYKNIQILRDYLINITNDLRDDSAA